MKSRNQCVLPCAARAVADEVLLDGGDDVRAVGRPRRLDGVDERLELTRQITLERTACTCTCRRAGSP